MPSFTTNTKSTAALSSRLDRIGGGWGGGGHLRIVSPVFDDIDEVVVDTSEVARMEKLGDGRTPVDIEQASNQLASALTLRRKDGGRLVSILGHTHRYLFPSAPPYPQHAPPTSVHEHTSLLDINRAEGLDQP